MLPVLPCNDSVRDFTRRFALHAREVPFEEVTLPIKLLPSGSPDALGKRPYLEHDGIKFDNTSAMIHHIDEVAHGDGFLPTDPVARAQVRALQEYCMTEVSPLQECCE